MVRIKERYLLVNIIYPDGRIHEAKSNGSMPDLILYNQPTPDELTLQALIRGIRSSVHSLFGDYGSGSLDRSLQVKYLSTATSTFILRTSRTHYRLAWAALTFMDRLPIKDGKPCVFRVVHVSGTIRKAEEEAIRRARLLVLQAKDGNAPGPSSDVLNALFSPSDDDPEEQDALVTEDRASGRDDDDDDEMGLSDG